MRSCLLLLLVFCVACSSEAEERPAQGEKQAVPADAPAVAAPAERFAFRTDAVGDQYSVKLRVCRDYETRSGDEVSMRTTEEHLSYYETVEEVAGGRAARVKRHYDAGPHAGKLVVVQRAADGTAVDEAGDRVDFLEQFESLMPVSPVREGDTWEARDGLGVGADFAHRRVAKASRARCTLERVEIDGARRFGRVAVEIEIEREGGPETLAGVVVFDLANGFVRSYDLGGKDAESAIRAEGYRTLQLASGDLPIGEVHPFR